MSLRLFPLKSFSSTSLPTSPSLFLSLFLSLVTHLSLFFLCSLCLIPFPYGPYFWPAHQRISPRPLPLHCAGILPNQLLHTFLRVIDFSPWQPSNLWFWGPPCTSLLGPHFVVDHVAGALPRMSLISPPSLSTVHRRSCRVCRTACDPDARRAEV